VIADTTLSIDAFLDAAAAKQPTPGGGSVTALVGALAASMGEMVLNYSIGKKKLARYESELRTALARLTRLRQMLLELLREDQIAFAALSEMRKLSDAVPDKQSQIAAALAASIALPQEIAAAADEVLQLCDPLVEQVNFYLLSDLAVAADLAMATLRCAIYNVRVNLADVTDARERERIEKVNQHLLDRGVALIRHLSPRIWERHARGE